MNGRNGVRVKSNENVTEGADSSTVPSNENVTEADTLLSSLGALMSGEGGRLSRGSGDPLPRSCHAARAACVTCWSHKTAKRW